MGNLGINALSDDQLLELLHEATQELAVRDPIVRSAAQQTIFDEAEKLKLVRDAAREACVKVRAKYERDIKADAVAEVQAAFDAGEINLPGAEETRLALDSGEQAREVVVQNLVERVRLALKASVPDEKALVKMAQEVYQRYMEMVDPGAAQRLRGARSFADYERVRMGQAPGMRSVPLTVPFMDTIRQTFAQAKEAEDQAKDQAKYDALFMASHPPPPLWPKDATALTAQEKAALDAMEAQRFTMGMVNLSPKAPWAAPPLTAKDIQDAYDAVNQIPRKPRRYPWDKDEP